MKKQPNPEDPARKAYKTRSRILDAAEKYFSERGFAGASMRDITAAAGVNLSVAYYYFKSKEELLHAVFDRYIRPFWEWQERALAAARSAAGTAPIPLRKLIEMGIFARSGRLEIASSARLRAMIFSRNGVMEGKVCRELAKATEKIRNRIFEEFSRACPHVAEKELRFRISCMHAVLDGLQLLAPFLKVEYGSADAAIPRKCFEEMLVANLEAMFRSPATLPAAEVSVPAKV